MKPPPDSEVIDSVAAALWRIVTRRADDLSEFCDQPPRVVCAHRAYAAALMCSPVMTAAFRRRELCAESR